MQDNSSVNTGSSRLPMSFPGLTGCALKFQSIRFSPGLKRKDTASSHKHGMPLRGGGSSLVVSIFALLRFNIGFESFFFLCYVFAGGMVDIQM